MTGESQTKTQQTTMVEMNDFDAKLFLEFQKNYLMFSTLIQSGIFTIKNGHAIVHFDKVGTLQEISLHTIGYKKGLPMVIQILPS